MIKLDKIKLISLVSNISNINESKFKVITNNSKVLEYCYFQQEPYNLFIKVDNVEMELVIEFTGKILYDRYPELINKENIRTCLENINKLELCSLDIDSIIQDAIVTKVDVTADIPCADCKAITQALHAGVKNHRKYISRRIKDNYVIEKNVQTKTRKLRLSVYDKAKELQLSVNKPFLEMLTAPDTLIQYFNGKVRMELNLNSLEQIRKNLGIKDTSITSVLSSTANPIMKFIDDAIDDTAEQMPVSSLRDYERLMVLRQNDNDMEKIEAIVRMYSSPKSHISQIIKPYKLLATLSNQQPIKDMLNSYLTEVFLAGLIVSI